MEDKALNRQFGLRLKFLREIENVTQAHLAEVIGVSEQYIGMIERGLASPSFKVINKLAQALHTEPANLFLFSCYSATSSPQPGSHGASGLDWTRFATHIGSWEKSLDDDRLYWTDSLFHLLGADPATSEPSADMFLSFVHREDREQVSTLCAQLMDGREVPATEFRLVRQDGAVRRALFQAEIQKNCDGKPVRIHGAILDVTERRRLEEWLQSMQGRLAERVRERTETLDHTVKQLEREAAERAKAQEELRRRGEWVQSFMRHAQSNIAIIDANETFVLVNSSFAAFFDKHPDELQGAGVAGYYPPDVLDSVRERTRRILAAGDVAKSEDRFIIKGRETVFLTVWFPLRNTAGETTAVGCIATDITARKRSEESVRQYQFITDATRDYMTMIGRDYRYRAANSAYCQAVGLAREDVVGARVEDIWGKEIFETAIQPRLDNALAGNEVQYEIWLDFRDRGRGCFEVNYYPFSDEAAKPTAAVVVTRDVTERRIAEDSLRKHQSLLTMTQKLARVGGWELDIETDEMVFSEELRQVVDPQRKLESTIDALLVACHCHDRASLEAVLDDARKKGAPFDLELRMVVEGEDIWVRALGRADVRQGKTVKLYGAVQDITDRKRTEARLRELATTDGLTQLWNRQYFMELAEKELSRSVRYNRPLCLMFLDLDNFKAVNDSYGHQAGDKVLQALAQVFRSVLREVDMVGRIGGEEFAALLPETELEPGAMVAERLRQRLAEQTVQTERGDVRVTVSIGVTAMQSDEEAAGPPTSRSMETLLKFADEALYAAKKKGRNCVQTF